MSAVDRAAAALIMIITLMKVVAQYTGPGLMRSIKSLLRARLPSIIAHQLSSLP